MTKLASILKSRHMTANKGPYSQSNGFPSNYVQMWELDYKQGWALKNWCFQTVVLEKILESPLGCKEIKPVNPKGNQPWIFILRTDAETPILWLPDAKNWLKGKDPNAGTEEPDGLPSMGSYRVGHDWSDLAAAAAASIYLFIYLLSKVRAERSYSTFKVRWGDLVQGKEQQLHFAGADMKRYPTSRVRETQVRW